MAPTLLRLPDRAAWPSLLLLAPLPETSTANRAFVASRAIDLVYSCRLHRFGPADPTFELSAQRLVRAFHATNGALTVAITGNAQNRRTFQVEAWGDTADVAWALEQAPSWIGDDDCDDDFSPDHPLLRRLHRQLVGLRLGQSPTVFDMLTRLVLQQRVAWRDAAYSFRRLTLQYGLPAPGPFSMTAALSPAQWRKIPLAEYVAHGVEGKRARTIRDAAVSARRVEEIRTMDREAANARLRAFGGIGVWTAQGVLGFALGDADAVQEQDYDQPRLVSMALAGEPRADDARMLELLAPYAGHRFRVVRMLMEGGLKAPRFGPRRGRSPWEQKRRR